MSKKESSVRKKNKKNLKTFDRYRFIKLIIKVILLIILVMLAIKLTGCGFADQNIFTDWNNSLYGSNSSGPGDTEPGLYFSCDYATVGETITAQVKGDDGDFTYTWHLDSKLTDVPDNALTITSDILEQTLTVTAEKSDGSVTYENSIYLSKLPVMYITTANGEIGDEDYTDASLSMQGSADLPLTNENSYEGDIRIHLRGNSTRYLEKSPYKIKLGEKTDLLGLGKSKHWVLLADAIDHTLVRNTLIMKLASDLGLEYSCNCTKVVVFVDDTYEGVYTLSEQIRIGKDQVNIYDWEDLAEELAEDVEPDIIAAHSGEWTDADSEKLENYLTANLDWLSSPYTFSYEKNTYCALDYLGKIPSLTGGFLLEADFYHLDSGYNSLCTAYMQPFYFNSPERAYTNDELDEYAYKYLQAFEYALHSDDFTYHEDDTHMMLTGRGKFSYETGWSGDETESDFSAPEYDGWRYTDFFDMDSLVNYFLVTEFSKNWDSMKNSVFLYKDLDSKACIGPVWDYDWALGNINMYNIDTYYPTGWHTTDIYFTNEQLYQEYNWYRYMIKDPVFVQAVYDRYQEVRPTIFEDIIKDGGELDTWREYLSEAGAANDARWAYTYRKYHSHKYEESWDDMEAFIDERMEWLDAQFADYDTLYKSLNP